MDQFKYVIGCGMPRSGTHTLAGIVSGCDGVNVPHEGSPLGDKNHVLPWEFDSTLADARIEEIERNAFQPEFNVNWEYWLVGDIAYYYPTHLKYFMEKMPTAKFILLVRDRWENIGSLCFRQSRQLRVPWMNEENPWWKKFNETAELPLRRHPWDMCYPKYKEGDPIETANRYYTDLNVASHKIREYDPERTLIVRTESINTEATQKNIFEFLDIPDGKRVYQPDLKIDASPWQGIKNLTVWGLPYGRSEDTTGKPVAEQDPATSGVRVRAEQPDAGTDTPDTEGERQSDGREHSAAEGA